ncbi:hypothetical protein [Nocardioides bigeumensis]|uniref:RsiG family protein n=1 Tax=Nocardioides bigeumensis TaxID=433657 RepID=UPI0031D90209
MSTPDLAGLDVGQLRAYRAALAAEEDTVSYWRRLLHGRIDLLEAQAVSDDGLTLEDLVRVLGDTGSGRSRRTLMRVPAPVALPDLPDLDQMAHLWASDPRDDHEVADVIAGLRAKETRLSDYRTALHVRIDAATGELITRYRADPSAALALLPRD